jgi:hypothetical protein
LTQGRGQGLDGVAFAAEAAAIAASSRAGDGGPCWELRELIDDVFERRIVYLTAEYRLGGSSASWCLGTGASWAAEPDDDCIRSDDDEEVEDKGGDGPVQHQGFAGAGPVPGAAVGVPSVTVRLYVSYSESYRLPQVHFDIYCPVDGRRLYLPVERLQQLGMFGICDAERDGTALIVSLGFCEELQLALYSVHSCDTMTLVRSAAETMTATAAPSGQDSHGQQGVTGGTAAAVPGTLRLVLMLIGPLLGAPGCLTHGAV